MPELKPHLLHATLVSEGFWEGYRIDCPYDADDPTKPCSMVDIDAPGRPPIPGCAGADWLDGLGMEILTGRVVDPVWPLAVDVTWHNGGDHLTIDVRVSEREQ